jgi:general secretion pathway protein G
MLGTRYSVLGTPAVAKALAGPPKLEERRRRGWRRDDGWTLIELLIVISLIMVLAAMGLVQYRNSVTAAKEAVLKDDLFRLRDAIDQYYADKAEYPASLDELASSGYLRTIPVDPFTRTRDSWQTVLAEPDVNNPTATIGVYDVKSGSDGTALDGTRYADW